MRCVDCELIGLLTVQQIIGNLLQTRTGYLHQICDAKSD